MVPNIYRPSEWLVLVTFVVPRILKWLVCFWKICGFLISNASFQNCVTSVSTVVIFHETNGWEIIGSALPPSGWDTRCLCQWGGGDGTWADHMWQTSLQSFPAVVSVLQMCVKNKIQIKLYKQHTCSREVFQWLTISIHHIHSSMILHSIQH